jgi:hypothetical protein
MDRDPERQVGIVSDMLNDIQTTLGAISAGTDMSARTVAAVTACVCMVGLPVLWKLAKIIFK